MKLKRFVLQDIDVLPKKSQKNILGGYGDDKESVCCYSKHWTDPETFSCPDADTCDELAGRDGWWSCNGDAC